MADASESNKVFNELEKSLHCRICLQPLKEPKLLPCFHTFCKPCLIKLVKRKGELNCPTCDLACPLHNGGVKGLEDNGLVNTAMDWISKQRSIDNDNENQKVSRSVHPTNKDDAKIKDDNQLKQAANKYVEKLKLLILKVRKEKTEEAKQQTSGFDLVQVLTQYVSPAQLILTEQETLTYMNTVISIATVICPETHMASRRGKKEVVAKIIRCKRRGTSKFLYPLNVTVNKCGELIIADAGNKRIIITDTNGEGKLIKLPFKPLDVAMSAEGKYLIIDGSSKKIAVLNENDLTYFKDEKVKNPYPWRIATDPVCKKIAVVNEKDLTYFTDEEVKNPYPWRIATDPVKGSVYVAHWDGIVAKGTDQNNHCIRKYDSKFKYEKSFGSYGIDNGQFEGPHYLHVSSEQVVYVSDWGNHRIQAFDEEGEFKFAIGGFGEGDGEFSFPEGVMTDTEGNLYACSRKKNFVQKFDPEGNFISRIAISKDVDPKRATGLLVTEDMKVVVADWGDYSIKVFEY